MHQDKLIAPQTASAAAAAGGARAGASSKKSSSEMSSTIWKLSLKQSAKTFCISCVFALWRALISVDNSFILPTYPRLPASPTPSHFSFILSLFRSPSPGSLNWHVEFVVVCLYRVFLSCIACWRCAWKTRRGCCCFELLAKVSAASKPNWCSTSRRFCRAWSGHSARPLVAAAAACHIQIDQGKFRWTRLHPHRKKVRERQLRIDSKENALFDCFGGSVLSLFWLSIGLLMQTIRLEIFMLILWFWNCTEWESVC